MKNTAGRGYSIKPAIQLKSMINWKDCLIPDIKLRNRVYVWVAYSEKPPYLPVAVAETEKELAELIGISVGTIEKSWYRYRHGESKKSRYHRVKVGYEEES